MDTTAERTEARRRLVGQIPAYLHWVLHEWDIPVTVRDTKRYNISTFHHPALKEALESLSPESELLELLELAYHDELHHGTSVEATAAEIESHLRACEPRRADRLFTYRNSCGSYLGRLAKKQPARIKSRRSDNKRWWVLHPPENPQALEQGVMAS